MFATSVLVRLRGRVDSLGAAIPVQGHEHLSVSFACVGLKGLAEVRNVAHS